MAPNARYIAGLLWPATLNKHLSINPLVPGEAGEALLHRNTAMQRKKVASAHW